MKKVLLIAAAILLGTAVQAKGYKDVITGSFETAADTVKFSSNLRNVAHHNVTLTLAIKNTDRVDATWTVAGQDNRISSDYNVTHFETITHAALPFTIDTTNVAKTVDGIGYAVNGDNYVYYKSIVIDNFPHQRIGGFFVLNTTTTGDYKIYISTEDYN